MKTLKRMLAVMLAVVMMMGLGVTSMAATPSADGKYTILVEIDTNGDGNAEDKIPVYLNADGSYTGTDGQTYKYSQPDTNEIENYGVATAFDALYATGKVNSFKAVEYLDTTTWEGTGVYGIAFLKNLILVKQDIITGKFQLRMTGQKNMFLHKIMLRTT